MVLAGFIKGTIRVTVNEKVRRVGKKRDRNRKTEDSFSGELLFKKHD